MWWFFAKKAGVYCNQLLCHAGSKPQHLVQQLLLRVFAGPRGAPMLRPFLSAAVVGVPGAASLMSFTQSAVRAQALLSTGHSVVSGARKA